MLRRGLLSSVVLIAIVGCSGTGDRGAASGTSGSLTIEQPAQGEIVATQEIEVAGRAPAGARIVQDISLAPDKDVIAKVDGTWSMRVDLEEGANELVFRVGDDHSTEVRLGITFEPGQSVAPSSQPAAPTPKTPAATNPTAAPHATSTPTPTPVPTPTVVAFGDGTHQVGSDIPAGTYRLREAASFCYWARLKGFGGTLDEILANDNVIDAYAIVTIAASDQGFESRGCDEWSADLSAVTATNGRIDADGTYVVNTDIAPGTWKSSGGDFCYWARVKGFGGTLNEIIANDNVLGGSTVVTIGRSDKGFITKGCGTWSRS